MAEQGYVFIAQRSVTRGFTLIELSIVLVIIGLIVGGVLMGQDLISAATVRAQIAQIEKYNAAVNTFRGKFGALPGDIPEPLATQAGLAPRGTFKGEGDGNGYLEGVWRDAAGANMSLYQNGGETAMFWSDLTYANGLNLTLIDGNFSGVSSTAVTADTTGTRIALYLPKAKMGRGNYIFAYSGDYRVNAGVNTGINYFGIEAVTDYNILLTANLGITVAEAYNMDTKIDDGMPQTGRVIARYDTSIASLNAYYWAGTSTYSAPYTTATPASATTCFDNANGAGAQQYSVSQNSGQGVNCALSFQFQ